MAANHSNDRLPFDVLGYAFAYYADAENIYYPLETLLLVCRSWNHAALEHRTLWSNLRIYIGHTDIFSVWNTRLPLRLARCGSGVPLDIDLRNFVDIPAGDNARKEVPGDDFLVDGCWVKSNYDWDSYDCPCDYVARVHTKTVLRRLTGENGRICAQWRSFKLDLGCARYGTGDVDGETINNGDIARAFSHPTPILKTLDLKAVHLVPNPAGLRLFPDTALLQNITLERCSLPSLPNMQNVRSAVMALDYSVTGSPNLSNFREATQLRDLCLRDVSAVNLPLPPNLTKLQVLSIQGSGIPMDLITCQMPRLVDLNIQCDDANHIEHILGCTGLAIESLQRITIEWEPAASMNVTVDEYAERALSVSRLLARCRDLQYLSTTGVLLSIVIKVLWVARYKGYQDLPQSQKILSIGAWLVDTDTGGQVKLYGDMERSYLENIARQWDLVAPNLPDDIFYDMLLSTI